MLKRTLRWRRRKLWRFWARRAGRLLEWTLCGGLIAVGVFFFWRYLRESPVFSIQWVCIEGAKILDPQSILSVSEVTTGDNLWLLDLETVKERVEHMPYVKTCKTERIFPDRVIITIEERAPKATLLLNNGLFEIDEDGVVLREVPRKGAYTGPLVTNVPGLVYVDPGQRLTEPSVAAALAVWDAFEKTPMAGEVTVSELAAFDRNKILMFCDELPFEIRWGRGGFDEQARRLNILWHEKNGRLECREYLDLRFGGDLVCK